MTTKLLSTLIACLGAVLAVGWTVERQTTTNRNAAILKVRSFKITEKTWARVDNWVKDLGLSPCQWIAEQSIPLISDFRVMCLVGGTHIVAFQLEGSRGNPVPMDDRTRENLAKMKEWVKARGQYP